MKKLKTWQIVLLVIFYPIGICVWIYRVWKKKRIKKENDAAKIARAEATARDLEQRRSVSPDFELKTFKVVGVTFKNADRKSRQTILRRIRFNDEPFDSVVDVTIERGEYDGMPAFHVFANGLQVGNISRDDIPYFLNRWSCFNGVYNATVIGGGTDSNGNSINYGMTITCAFKK